MQRWFFMTTIKGFYTNSPESAVEKQFADLRKVHTSRDFVDYLDNEIKSQFTDDYFKYNLPNDLVTSSTQSPAWYGYVASLNVLGYPMLFSNTPTSKYFLSLIHIYMLCSVIARWQTIALSLTLNRYLKLILQIR